MPDDPERYVETGELKPELTYNAVTLGLSDAEFQTVLQNGLSEASDFVEQWTGTVFTPTTATARVAQPPRATAYDLPLPERPIQSVSSVTVDGTSLTEGDDYRISRDATHLRLIPGAAIDEWPAEDAAALAAPGAEVEWTYGYETLPGPVRSAVVRIARHYVAQIHEDGLEQESAEDRSEIYRPPEAIKAECKTMIEGYDTPSYSGAAGAMVA